MRLSQTLCYVYETVSVLTLVFKHDVQEVNRMYSKRNQACEVMNS